MALTTLCQSTAGVSSAPPQNPQSLILHNCTVILLSGRRRKPKGRKGPYTKNLQKLLFSSNPFDSTHVGDKISCEDVTQSDEEIATILHRVPTTSHPEPYSPALSSTSFLVPSPVPSSFVSSPSPSLFMDSPPSSPCVASPVSPAPEPSSAPAVVHPTPLPHVPVQAPSSQLVMGPTPPFLSPSLVIEKMEKFNRLHNYYISNYNKMTYDAKCYAHYWCQQFRNGFMSSAHICKQQRNGNSEARSRRENIRLVAIEEGQEGTNPRQFCATALKEILNLEETPRLDRGHRSLAPRPGEGERPRPFVIRVHHGDVKDRILRLSSQKKQLFYKEKRVHIFPDFTPEIVKKRAAFKEAKQLLRTVKDVKFGPLSSYIPYHI